MTHLPPEQDVGNWICDVLNCHSLEESVSKAISECVIKRFSQAQEIAVQCGHLFADLQGLPASQALGSSAMQHLGKILLYFNPTNSQNPCSANGRDGVLTTECLSQDSNRGFELGSLLSLDIKIFPEKMFVMFSQLLLKEMIYQEGFVFSIGNFPYNLLAPSILPSFILSLYFLLEKGCYRVFFIEFFSLGGCVMNRGLNSI